MSGCEVVIKSRSSDARGGGPLWLSDYSLRPLVDSDLTIYFWSLFGLSTLAHKLADTNHFIYQLGGGQLQCSCHTFVQNFPLFSSIHSFYQMTHWVCENCSLSPGGGTSGWIANTSCPTQLCWSDSLNIKAQDPGQIRIICDCAIIITLFSYFEIKIYSLFS